MTIQAREQAENQGDSILKTHKNQINLEGEYMQKKELKLKCEYYGRCGGCQLQHSDITRKDR